MPEKDQKSPKPAPPASPASFQAPRGTRDFYPDDQARRRHVFETWRRSALRHGFHEIDGPTFEHLDLYTVKSGQAIVSELFSFQREGGEQRYALRPEFTPTLARMIAARANALPKPVMWFSIANYFRAERPQRGRLREFAQWNVDVLGDDSPKADAMCIACCVEALRSFGLTDKDVRIRVSDRSAVSSLLASHGVAEERLQEGLQFLDALPKLDEVERNRRAVEIGLNPALLLLLGGRPEGEAAAPLTEARARMQPLWDALESAGVAEWCSVDFSIVRGLAYYTGTVFEIHEAGGKERAIAGGGRYDGLVELFGGPPTPAVGFAMGDVVLSLVLEDKGLMPRGAELLESISARPDAFLIAASESADETLDRTLANLRANGLHARRSFRATRNVGKLLKDAERAHARCAVILEDSGSATIKNLDTGAQQDNIPLDALADHLRTARS